MCGACSEVYRGDAWQLVVSGLRCGKGVPESVVGHPLVFATFTAPSFGPVHTVRELGGKRAACRPRSRGETYRGFESHPLRLFVSPRIRFRLARFSGEAAAGVRVPTSSSFRAEP